MGLSSTTLPPWYVSHTNSRRELLDKPFSLDGGTRHYHQVHLQTEEPHSDTVHARNPLFSPSWRIRHWLVSLPFAVASSSSSDPFRQYASGRKPRDLPDGTIHRERHETGVVLLSADWALPKGHGFRYQRWR
jgi:hypothetical protein